MGMVEPEQAAKRLVEAARAWFELRKPRAELHEKHSGGETEMRIAPTSGSGAAVTILVLPYGRYELTAGRAIHFEEVSSSPEQLTRVLEAIAAGEITEKIWTIRDRLVRHEGRIAVPGTDWKTRGSSSWLGMLGMGRATEIHYDPW